MQKVSRLTSNMSIYEIIKENRRKILNLREIGLPEVPVVGVNIQTSACGGLARHKHPGIFEAVYMVRGRQIFSIKGREYLMKSNDLFISQPGIYHGSGSYLMEKAFFYWLQIRLPQKNRPFLCLDAESSLNLSNSLIEIMTSRFQGKKIISEHFEQIFRLYTTKAVAAKLEISIKIIELLLLIIDCANKTHSTAVTKDINTSLKLLEGGTDKFFTLEQMAAAGGLSSSRFKCKFKQQIGLPPAEYQLREKIEAAKTLLETTDKNVTEIAHKLGFSSSQYFATVFKRFTRNTPSQWRQKIVR